MDPSQFKDTLIFRGMTEDEIESALKNLSAVEKKYRKGSVILHAGSTTDMMGLVLDGSVTIENNDIWGNKTILSHIEKKQFFAETYGFFSNEPLLVDVVANENCVILFLRIGILNTALHDHKLSTSKNGPVATQSSATTPHQQHFTQSTWATKLISNLLIISAQKNLMLSGRSFHTSPKSIRMRVMSYLNSISIKTGKTEFDIPFDRQQMADYLNVERTALSKELSKMVRDGLIRFNKSHFVLLETGDLV